MKMTRSQSHDGKLQKHDNENYTWSDIEENENDNFTWSENEKNDSHNFTQSENETQTNMIISHDQRMKKKKIIISHNRRMIKNWKKDEKQNEKMKKILGPDSVCGCKILIIQVETQEWSHRRSSLSTDEALEPLWQTSTEPGAGRSRHYGLPQMAWSAFCISEHAEACSCRHSHRQTCDELEKLGPVCQALLRSYVLPLSSDSLPFAWQTLKNSLILYPPLLRGCISACCLTSFFLNAWLDLAAFFAKAPLNKPFMEPLQSSSATGRQRSGHK